MCHSLGGHKTIGIPLPWKTFAAATLFGCRHSVRVTFLNTSTVERNLGLITWFGCVRHHLRNQLGISSYRKGNQPGGYWKRAFFRHRARREAQAAVPGKVYCFFTLTEQNDLPPE